MNNEQDVRENTDHDMLVMLNVKFDQMSIDFKRIGNDLIMQVKKLEIWKESVDIYHARIPIEEYSELARWVRGFRSNIKFIIPLALTFLGVVAAVATRLLEQWLRF